MAALQEKLRLMEDNKNQVNNTVPESVGQELRQSSSDNDVGSMRGNLESSVSARKQHRPFIIYPKLKFKACSSCSFLI